MIFRQSDGVRIAADLLGPEEGPCVILAHGGGQTRHSWSSAAERLAQAGYRVVNYDARGHGGSDWSADNTYPLARRWEDMKAIVQSVQKLPGGPVSDPFLPDRVALVGASMGGASAMFGLACGYRPDALVLVDIAPNPERAGMERVRDFMARGLGGFSSLDEAADAVAAYNPARPRSSDTAGLRRNLNQKDDGRWYWHWDPGMIDVDIDRERALMQATFKALEAATDVPVLLVRGLLSDVVSAETVEEVRRRLPLAEVAEIRGAGHMVAGDRNDAFLDAILDFFARHMPAKV